MKQVRLQLERYVLGRLGTNCYLLWDTASKQALVIDPADEATLITEAISRAGLTLTGIYLTHAHFDHLLGLLELQLATGAPAYLHPADLFLLNRAQSTAEHFLGQASDPVPSLLQPLTDRQALSLDLDMTEIGTTYHVPGHTPGSCAFYIHSSGQTAISCSFEGENYEQLLFVGDTLLPGENTDLSHAYSSAADWKKSIASIAKLPGETLISTWSWRSAAALLLSPVRKAGIMPL